MPATSAPSLSQVLSWDACYLEETARSWTGAAAVWDDAYWRAYQQVQRPGGTEWMGAAADAAYVRVGADRREVVGAVDALHGAATAARVGARRLSSARQQVLDVVAQARAAGFDVDDDYTVSSRDLIPAAAQAAVQAQAEAFADRIHAKVFDLIAADRETTAQIAMASAGLDGLSFEAERSTAVQAVGFHGMPFPEKPPNPPVIPPPEGWSKDPLMRAAQKIAYGHASDPVSGHMDDFPGMTKAQLAETIHQKMQRAITDPRGLTIGASKSDGVPVIYDPKDNVMIIRDTRPNAPDGGTVFKPDPAKEPDFVANKFGWYESAFKPSQLEDLPMSPPATQQPLPPVQGKAGVPGGPVGGVATAGPGPVIVGGGGGSWGDIQPAPPTFPGWGTFVSPGELAKQGGDLGNLGKFLEPSVPYDPNDPDHNA